jgi:hypothetical protein
MMLRLSAVGAVLLAALPIAVVAQGLPPPGPDQNPVCVRLESQLALIDRGGADPARAEQIRRYEETVDRQQFELDRTVDQARRAGCESSGFFLFGGQPPQCGEINGRISRMRSQLDRSTIDLERLRGGNVDRGEQRRGILAALAQNNCGPQYRNAALSRPQNFFDALFGGGGSSTMPPPDVAIDPDAPQSSTFRTVCVRTCDGFYFPISFSTVPSRFADDERTCQRMCPASEALLFSHRNPGEDMRQAVSVSGKPYTELPNAFRYRQEFNASCSCRRAGQSWTEAVGQRDSTVERGDIVVTEDRSKAMAQPRPDPKARQDARRAKPDSKGAPEGNAAPAAAADPGTSATGSTEGDGQRKIRAVGPQFYPLR